MLFVLGGQDKLVYPIGTPVNYAFNFFLKPQYHHMSEYYPTTLDSLFNAPPCYSPRHGEARICDPFSPVSFAKSQTRRHVAAKVRIQPTSIPIPYHIDFRLTPKDTQISYKILVISIKTALNLFWGSKTWIHLFIRVGEDGYLTTK
jgi:hypothetical protein